MKFLRDIIDQKSNAARPGQAVQGDQPDSTHMMAQDDAMAPAADNDWNDLFDELSAKDDATGVDDPEMLADVDNMFADDPRPEPELHHPTSLPDTAVQDVNIEAAKQAATELPTRQPEPASAAADPQQQHIVEEVPAMQDPVAPEPAAQPAAIEVPPPAAGRGSGRAGRARTRILGFNPGAAASRNPFDKAAGVEPTQSDDAGQFPVGWLVVVDGPGLGTAFTLSNGVAQIGRGEGQTIRLDFGDNSISRENHAAIAFDPEENSFFIGHGGKANLVRCNGMPVLSTQPLSPGDRVRIGETTLLFTPLCGPGFSWNNPNGNETQHVARG